MNIQSKVTKTLFFNNYGVLYADLLISVIFEALKGCAILLEGSSLEPPEAVLVQLRIFA